MKILLVEDDDLVARSLRLLLEHRIAAPLTIVRAATLVEATCHAVRDFDLVITDWSFPYTTGQDPRDGIGQMMVDAALIARVPVAVFSGSDKPRSLVGIPWFDKCDTAGLIAWVSSFAPGERAAAE